MNLVIALGLTNILTIFQNYTSKTLIELINIYYIIYFNYLLICFISEEKFQNYIKSLT